MKLPPQSRYPKSISYRGEPYEIRFIKRFRDRTQSGECDSGSKIIRIQKGLSKEETMETFIHELLHLVEFEHPIKIEHKLIYKLSEAIFELLVENF